MRIRKIIKCILPSFLLSGLEPYLRLRETRGRSGRKNINMFKRNFQKKSKLLADNRFSCNWEDIWVCLNDRTANTGFDYHYTYHTAWASRVLAKTMPQKHIDISSSIRFITCISAFVPVEFYDYRPAQLNLSNLKTGFADVTKLPFDDDSIESLSSMHVVEHIGLERYGDPFDPQGDLKAISELQRVLMPDGNLLFVVPVGRQMRIQYNAHRIYTYDSIVSYFTQLKLLQFTLITDDGQYLENSDGNAASKQNYGCGCFLFTKDR